MVIKERLAEKRRDLPLNFLILMRQAGERGKMMFYPEGACFNGFDMIHRLPNGQAERAIALHLAYCSK